MKEHVCEEPSDCICDPHGLEPHDECPIHACGIWPARCKHCGRYMKREPYCDEITPERQAEIDEMVYSEFEP